MQVFESSLLPPKFFTEHLALCLNCSGSFSHPDFLPHSHDSRPATIKLTALPLLCDIRLFILSFPAHRIMSVPDVRIRRKSSLERCDPYAIPEVYYAKEGGYSSLVRNRVWVTKSYAHPELVNRRRASHGKLQLCKGCRLGIRC